LGYVSLSRHEPSQAADEFTATLAWATRAEHSLRGESDQLRWQHELTGIYRGLARAQSMQGRPEEAARTWLTYLFAPRYATPDVARMASSLSRDTLLWYVQYEDGIAIGLLDNRGLHSYWSAVPQEVFDTAAASFANACARSSADPGSLRKQGQQLYGWLVLPAAKEFDGERTIVIATDRAVSEVPFQALRAPDGGYFGAKYAIARAGGEIAAKRQDRVTNHEHALIAGAPAVGNYAASFPPLPDAVREMQAVSKDFVRPVVLEGDATNGERIRREWTSATLFHFAGHTVANLGLGGLVLSARSDGPEILDAASLGAGSLSRCKLAVLSACDSALGETSQAIDPDNLVEALLRTGIHTVVASRWNVDSHATAAYMESFYAALLGGASTPAAMRTAANDLRNNPKTQRPYYWAAFDSYSRELP
jgi:CHAT domain-containing protein